MNSILQDFRYGLRSLGNAPAFSLVAIATLALGIGANTAIFSVLDPVLLRPLPIPEPDRLVALTDPETNGFRNGLQTGVRSLFAYSEFEAIRDRNQVFEGIFASSGLAVERDVAVEGESQGQVHRAQVKLVSGGYFPTLEVHPEAGRVFGHEADQRRGEPPVAVISHGYWQRQFGGRLSALGRALLINHQALEIIGVMPKGFFGETVGVAPDIWIPITLQEAVHPGKDYLSPRPGRMDKMMWLQVFGRLKQGATPGEASANVNLVFRTLLEGETSNPALVEHRDHLLDQRIELRDASRGGSVLRGGLAAPLEAVMALVAVVLLIACANLANLLLARARTRRREVSLRLALGSSRARLLRQFLTESLILSLLGGGAGLTLSPWIKALLLSGPGGAELAGPLSGLTGRVLLFTAAVAILCSLLFGAFPAIRSSSSDLASALRFGGPNDPGTGRLRTGRLLVAGQVALSLLLVATAGLFLRSLHNVSVVETGFDPHGLLEFSLDPISKGYSGARLDDLFHQLHSRLEALPGVLGVTLSDNGLFSRSDSVDPIQVDGYEPPPDERPRARYDHVGSGFFSTTGIPLLTGRDTKASDSVGEPRPAVINETMARLYFGAGSAIGKRFRNSHPENPGEFEVVGVAADSKHSTLREPARPRYYVPFFHPIYEVGQASFLVRVSGDLSALVASIRGEVAELDPNLVPIEVEYLPDTIDHSLERDRLVAKVSSFLGLLALLLASVGMYGLIGYEVIRRSREIGVRMAVGASRQDVARMVLSDCGKLLVPGMMVGLAAAFAVSRFFSSLLFQATAADPLVIGVSALTMTSVGLLAAYLPAHRASRLDPTIILRGE